MEEAMVAANMEEFHHCKNYHIFFLPVVLVFLVLGLADKAVELEDLLARQEFQFPLHIE